MQKTTVIGTNDIATGTRKVVISYGIYGQNVSVTCSPFAFYYIEVFVDIPVEAQTGMTTI